MLRLSQNWDIIQINNNMKTLASAKEQYGLSEVKTIGAVASPDDKSFHQ